MIGRDSYRFVREKAIAKVFFVGVLFNISHLVFRNVHKKKKKKKKRGEFGQESLSNVVAIIEGVL